MRFLRLIPLLGLPLLLLGATCVTRVEQQGPTGPWVGEVTNTDATAMGGARVSAVITDATGKKLSESVMLVCPPDVQPGQKGTFELALSKYIASTPSLFTPPLQATFRPFAESTSDAQPPMQGVTARLLSTDEAHNAIVAEIRNDSASTYDEVAICANIRGASGELLAVGSGHLFPTTLKPGELRAVPLYFDSLPQGSYEFFATSSSSGEEWTLLSPSKFRTTATKVITTPNGKQLLAVGEVENTSGLNLGGTQIQAFLKNSATVQTMTLAGCNGIILAGQNGPALFILPLNDEGTGVTVSGIQGIPLQNVSRIPTKDAAIQGTTGDQVFVKVTLENPSSSYVHIDGICFNLRGSGGSLVGTSNSDFGGDIPPGGAWVVNGGATELAETQSVEVIAYGHPVNGIPPTPAIGPPLS